jgi:hypothetical protein
MVNLTLSQGDDTSRTWQITSSDEAVNLASATITAIIKPSPQVADDASSALSLTEGDGITISDAADGEVTIAIPTEVTESPGAWYYKILIGIGGATEVAIHGWITTTDT